MKPRGWKQGDPISAARLNGTNAEAGRPRRQSSTGTGSSMVNETMGNQSHAAYEAGTRLVIAKEDFGPSNVSTDIYGLNDPQYSGKCMMMRLVSSGNAPSGLYEEEVFSKEFRVWDPIALLSSTASKSEGDIFYTVYNKDSKRWEIPNPISKNCGEVRFQILASDSTTRTSLCVILARPYGCGITDIPATVFEGQAIEVCDPSGCFFNETNAMLVGRDGWAKYMMPVSGASWCQGSNPYYGMQPEWEVYSLCCATDSCAL